MIKYFKQSRTGFFFCILIAVPFFACSPVKKITISILNPAEINIPPEINKVSIVSRIPTEFENGKLSMLNNLRFNPDKNYFSFSSESLFALIDLLEQSPRFQHLHLAGEFLKLQDPYTTDNPINWKDLIRKCKNDSTDALISFEFFELADSLDINTDYYQNCEVSYTIYYKAHWIIYNSQPLEYVDNFYIHDSLNWVTYDVDCNNAVNQMPNIDDMLMETFNHIGSKYAKRIVPLWYDDIQRFYYASGNRNLSQANKLLKEDNISGAMEIWQRLVDEENKNVAAKAAFNLALANELQDNLETALYWTTTSNNIKYNKLTEFYKNVIQSRINAKAKVTMQLLGE
ncbi:MAG: hypothetical protein JXJ22_03265 [Bacteroidales bacterium]|nr:hypothetical protein [Bacteroidales bacterium]